MGKSFHGRQTTQKCLSVLYQPLVPGERAQVKTLGNSGLTKRWLFWHGMREVQFPVVGEKTLTGNYSSFFFSIPGFSPIISGVKGGWEEESHSTCELEPNLPFRGCYQKWGPFRRLVHKWNENRSEPGQRLRGNKCPSWVQACETSLLFFPEDWFVSAWHSSPSGQSRCL